MPAVSKKQQKFFGIVRAIQKGEMAPTTPETAKAAADMKKGDVKKFASTKHKGLPEKKKIVEDKQVKKIIKQLRKSVKAHKKQADTLEKKVKTFKESNFSNITVGNKVGQTFQHATGGTITLDGALGGKMMVPSQVTVELPFGEGEITVDGPTESEFGLAGFTKPLDFKIQKRISDQTVAQINDRLDASQEASGAETAKVSEIPSETTFPEMPSEAEMKANYEKAREGNPSLPPFSEIASDFELPDIPKEGWTYEQYMKMYSDIQKAAADRELPIAKQIVDYSPTGTKIHLDKFGQRSTPIGLIDARNAITNAATKALDALTRAWEAYNKIPEPSGYMPKSGIDPYTGIDSTEYGMDPARDWETEARPDLNMYGINKIDPKQFDNRRNDPPDDVPPGFPDPKKDPDAYYKYGSEKTDPVSNTQGEFMPSNPQGMRQQGVGKSANDLGRHSPDTSGTVSTTNNPFSSVVSTARGAKEAKHVLNQASRAVTNTYKKTFGFSNRLFFPNNLGGNQIDSSKVIQKGGATFVAPNQYGGENKPIDTKMSFASKKEWLKDIDPDSGYTAEYQIGNKSQSAPWGDGTMATKAIHSQISASSKGIVVTKDGGIDVNDTYAFTPGGHEHKGLPQLAKKIGGTELQKDAATFIDKSIGNFMSPSYIPGRKDPIVFIRTRVTKNELIKMWGKTKYNKVITNLKTGGLKESKLSFELMQQFRNEAANPAQQAAIAISMKKKGIKPKNLKEQTTFPQMQERIRNAKEKRREQQKKSEKLYMDTKKKGVKFYDKKGTGRLKDGKKVYD